MLSLNKLYDFLFLALLVGGCAGFIFASFQKSNEENHKNSPPVLTPNAPNVEIKYPDNWPKPNPKYPQNDQSQTTPKCPGPNCPF